MPTAKTEGLRSRPYLLSIPAGVPFLDCLAEALLDGGLLPGLKPLRNDPLALADALIFLPTRRAGREFAEIIAWKLGGAAVLPRILALGDIDEDDFEDGERPDAVISETERRLVLAKLIGQWAKAVGGAIADDKDEADLISTSPAEAVSLAIALGQLIDSFETEHIEWAKLTGLVPPEHDDVWRLTTNFLTIAAEFWPAHLKEKGQIGPALRRNALLDALGHQFSARPPSTPVIVAGSTGSNPATAELMRVVAHLPFGGVVLHGLDVRADAETWAGIGGDGSAQSWTHPQHAFHRLLTKLGVQLGEVGTVGKEDRERDRRRALVSQAMLPSELTSRWHSLRIDNVGAALEGVTLIEAANEREEALSIAVALREALEMPDKTAALITPDRTLARRVAAELKRWDIETEDSAGLPLADSQAGILARLVAETAAHNFAPRTLIPLLHHSGARFGLESDRVRHAAEVLEIAVLRGPAPPPGVEGLQKKLEIERAAPEDEKRFWHPAKRELRDADWDAARDLAERLEAAVGPLARLGGFDATLYDFLATHSAGLWNLLSGRGAGHADYAALDEFFQEARSDASKTIRMRLNDYPAAFKTLLRGKTSRAKRATHPRLRILGTLEARLLGFDRIVLGGLNEGTWPAQAENDPFLSRPMRGALGLPPPEWRTGQSAHDFEQALGGRDVVLTRAKKQGGAPAVAARWLQRMKAVVGDAEWRRVVDRGEEYLKLASALDPYPDELPDPRTQRPQPKPPRHLRPKRLSVTEVETLIRDPYALYAKHVLNLRPLDPPGVEPGASDRGTIIHGALAEFIAKEDVFAPDAEERLIAYGRAAFAPLWDYPDVRALWWPRFGRIARWFIYEFERPRRAGIARVFTERQGKLPLKLPSGSEVTLSGRADRFDELTSGQYSVVDYKTGTLPGHGEVLCGLAPQLPLEAAMLKEGAFGEPHAGIAHDFTYVRLTGQGVPGEEREINLKGQSADAVADEALRALKTLLARFDDDAQPYRSGMHPKFRRRPDGEYDHLARFAEWGLSPDDDGAAE